ncbi:MAG: NUDIX domain-containing protein [Chloroflexi bacterium]|nr:NUDIX domain-containing protein [Chloroflexota bacterium]
MLGGFVPPRIAVIVVGAVVRQGDRVLFVRQTYGAMKDMWGLPTGILDSDEEPHLAARREVREEAGIVAEIEGLINLTTLDYFGGPMLYLTFLARHVSGQPTPDGAETDRATYLALDGIRGETVGPIEPLCRWLAERVLTDDVQVLHLGDLSAYSQVFAYRSTYG